ncbi:F-box only protein 21 [Lachnellula cervina]|uniref:F-box only protein 21 n=1 Tax=Lachnellula cervina TaxID=1316786 RepID=A0A7D8YUY3_9HELO|nr:F-box only protein 21 [Lachnellula cervina]
MAATRTDSGSTTTPPPKQPPKSFNDLPDEIIQHILYFVPPLDIILSVQRTSQRLHNLSSQPLLWRYHCRVQFTYWDPKHRIRQKFLGGIGDVDWQALYAHRAKVDLKTTRILDSTLERQVDRIQKFELIADFGYDAKDTLLQHCHTDEQAEDVLARRYYANAILDHVHRTKALAEWEKILRGEDIPIERALGSFDLFVLHDQPGDLLEISDLLDDIVIRLRVENPNIAQLCARKKALAVVRFLRAHNLTGIASEIAYRDLQNNYIGIALQDQDHPSLPLISVAIFCAVARRLGLDAKCCGIPNHVHAMVSPRNNESLDGHPTNDNNAEPMYLDPYRSDAEVPVWNLQVMLAAWGIQEIDQPLFLNESSTAGLIVRTSRNILATVHEFRGQAANTDDNHHPTVRLHANPYADLDNAFYSALWANFLFATQPRSEVRSQRHFIPLILEKFEHLYPMDASLIEQYICPLFNNPSVAEHWELHEALRVVRAADQTPKQITPRDTPAAHAIKYKVGQVFRHRRYNYMAVITGWDVECGMGTDWCAHNQVDLLSRGRNQSFFHALVDDTSIRYVAEENIEVIEPEVPIPLMSLAGRFFKRWDQENHVFVSNIRDEYPDN